MKWIQKDLFSEDNMEPQSDQQLQESQVMFNPDLFSVSSRRVLDVHIMEELEHVELYLLEGHADWPMSRTVVERFRCKSLADVARLTDSQISKVPARPLTRRDAVRRLRNDVLDHASQYLQRWEEECASRRLVLQERDFVDLSAFVEAIARCLKKMVEEVESRMELPYIYKEYFVEQRTFDDIQHRHPDTTSESKRLKLMSCIRVLISGETWMGHSFDAPVIGTIKSFLEQKVYTSVTYTHPLPHCALAFLRVCGYDVLERRADSLSGWDFITLVYREDIRQSRLFMAHIIQQMSFALQPVSLEKALVMMMNDTPDIDMPYERKRLFVRRTLQSHPWIEHSDAGLRLLASRLRRDYERYARIIYDAHRPITLEEMASRYEQIYHCRSKSLPLNVVKSKYEGFHCYGKTGYWEYVGLEAKKETKEPVMHRIARWLDEGTLPETFFLDDIVALLAPSERAVYSLSTLSSYALACAVRDMNRADHFCKRGCEARYPQYRWRVENDNKAMPNFVHQVVEWLKVSPWRTLPMREISHRFSQDFKVKTPADRVKRDSRLNRLRLFSAPSLKEARDKGLPFAMRHTAKGLCLTLCAETLSEGTVQSFQMNRREHVRRMYGLLYESTRALLSSVPEREMELVEVIRHFMQSESFRSQPDSGKFTALRLRGAFANALKPRMFEPVKHGRRVFVRLVEVE